MESKMKCVILAGGLGTRLSEETVVKPKPSVEIGDRPILWHIMKYYARFGITEFIVCLGYKGYVIKEYFANYSLHNADLTVDLERGALTWHRRTAEPWKVTLVDTGHDTMTGGRLKRIGEYLTPGEAFCMTYGDGLSDIDIAAEIAFHKAQKRKATVACVRPPARFGSVKLDGARVASFAEKLPSDAGLINGGFFVLEPSVLDYIDGDKTVWEQKPLERLAAEGQLSAWVHEGFWQPMDTLRDKRQLEELWTSGKAPWKVW